MSESQRMGLVASKSCLSPTVSAALLLSNALVSRGWLSLELTRDLKTKNQDDEAFH